MKLVFVSKYYNNSIFSLLDPCFAAECRDCAAKPDDSTTCGEYSIINISDEEDHLYFGVNLTRNILRICMFFSRSW